VNSERSLVLSSFAVEWLARTLMDVRAFDGLRRQGLLSISLTIPNLTWRGWVAAPRSVFWTVVP